MRKAINIATTVVLILVLIFAALLVLPRLFGYEPYTVLSGSMEPEYHVGSLIYVRPTSAAELKVNMPITYRMENGTVVTHRIIEVIVDDNDPTSVSYRTKGDANEDADGTPVHISSVIGRPMFEVPLIGYACYFIQHPPGSFITVAALMIFVIIAFLPDLFSLLREDAREKKGKANAHEREELLSELETLKIMLEEQREDSDK